MKNVIKCSLLILFAILSLITAQGCENDDSSKKKSDDGATSQSSQNNSSTNKPSSNADSADNEGDDDGEPVKKSIVAAGDSITTGETIPSVRPYPTRVGIAKNRQVFNMGRGGERACRGADRIKSFLSKNPDVVLILYGTNDVLGRWDQVESKECIRRIIRAVKADGATPVVGTIPPLTGAMAKFMPRVDYMNDLIRALASEEGVRLADVAREFGSGEGLMLADGIHPNETGTQVIAFTFAGAF